MCQHAVQAAMELKRNLISAAHELGISVILMVYILLFCAALLNSKDYPFLQGG
jgi:hypothetical protein